jgi:NAD(P)H-dependent FMN reductase
MKIAIISGSHRPSGQSGRIADFLASRVESLKTEAQTYVLKLTHDMLPLWDESMWGQEGQAKEAYAPIAKELQSCDAAIVIAPEYNGTAPAALKNFFHYASGNDLGHKAGLLVGVSGSINGAYPIAEMRSHSSKNCKICYMPDHLVVRHAAEVLKDDVKDDFKEDDAYMRERIDYTLNVFFEYAEALNKVRESDVVKNTPQKYAFGQ